MNIPNSEQPINPTTFRQTGHDDFRLATIKDENEGLHLFDSKGLTKREYFAGLAMQSIIIAKEAETDVSNLTREAKVRLSIAYADELLKQLENEN